MNPSNMAAPSVPDDAPATAAVKQWFGGEIEASYYGVPSRVPAASSDSVGRRYRLHVYRAAVLRAEPLDAKEAETNQTAEPFFQASIELAQIWGLLGPGTRYEGPVHDVSITQVQTRFHIVKDGKSYGTLRGYARGWLYLPPNVDPKPPSQVDPGDRVEMQTGVLIHEQQPENAIEDVVRNRRVPDRTPFEGDAMDASVDDADPAAPERMSSSQKTEPPFFSLCAAVGLLLWFSCGVEQTLLWFLFMLPTLGIRRLVFEMLPYDRGVKAFAVVMILGAILSSGTILASFRVEACWTLEALPLTVLVGSVFLSGIVPYRLPLAITAVMFACVLFVWGYTPDRHCPGDSPGTSLPTIKDPGVPRTNDDGTWPRRAPTSESSSGGE